MKYKDKYAHCYVRWLALKHLALGWTPYWRPVREDYRDALLAEFLKSVKDLQRTATFLKVDPRLIPFVDLNPYTWSTDRLHRFINGKEGLRITLTTNLLASPVNLARTEQTFLYQKVVAWLMQAHRWLPSWSAIPATWRADFEAVYNAAGCPITVEQSEWLDQVDDDSNGLGPFLHEWLQFCEIIDINGRLEGGVVRRALEAYVEQPVGSRRWPGGKPIPMHFHHLGLCDALRYGNYYPLTQKSVPPELVITAQASPHFVGGMMGRPNTNETYWDIRVGEGPNGENPIPLSERMTEFNARCNAATDEDLDEERSSEADLRPEVGVDVRMYLSLFQQRLLSSKHLVKTAPTAAEAEAADLPFEQDSGGRQSTDYGLSLKHRTGPVPE